ncbi:pilus assembly protein CpaE [uncultured Frigoribacterium sp.]|jgi:hypothetical protein|uniref:pilus assembly protein CpaE n=1 Tax=uncultured Frigoribacterium sp. TaxID=335377 RepID=UPI0028D570A1|nr:pilus assembly protein CpaE [uncultured Frigoribacterium sp.]
MIDVDLARRLADSGLRWRPATGDRFVIDTVGFAEDVFTLSEMTIEAHEHPTGTVLGFNGTTEWALDSVAADDSLWLPREDQLRLLLSRAFRSLTRVGTGDSEVRVVIDGDERVFTAADAEDAYAQALLAYIAASVALDDPDVASDLDGAGGPDVADVSDASTP